MSNNKDTEEMNEEDIDEDELLAMLSPEELKELQSEMDIIIAPDERVPVGQRQKDQTEKPPTGTFDHRSLVDYLYWEKESKRMLEEERVPATLLPSEKILKEEAEKKEKEEEEKKEEEEEKEQEEKLDKDVEYVYEVIEEEVVEDAFDGVEGGEVIEIIEEIIEEVEEEEEEEAGKPEEGEKDKEEAEVPDGPGTLRPPDDGKDRISPIAAGRLSPSDAKETRETGRLAQEGNTTEIGEGGGINIADSEPEPAPEETGSEGFTEKLPPKEERKINKLKIPKLALGGIKLTSRPSGNETNLDTTLDKIRKNNPSVTEVNLNNIENIPKEMLLDYVHALKKNKYVKTLSLANTGVDENVAFNLANMLRENRSVATLNVESNFITGKGIVAIIRCLQFNETLTELRFHNQRHMLGHHAEMEISRLLKANNTLLKMGYHFEQPGPRMVVTNLLTRNLDRQRQLRKEEQKQQQVKEQREVMQMYENSLNLPPGLLEMLGYIPSLELLQSHGLVPPTAETAALRTDAPPSPQPPKQLRRSPDSSIPDSRPANPLQDVRLKRTPKKRDPFLELDPRDDGRSERASFRLKKTPRAREAAGEGAGDERASLKDVIKTLKPVPRRREPAKVEMTPRDLLLSEIKQSNVAYLKAVPLPKVLESSETSLF